ncbi:restriction endonuclease subunit S [Tenacibaculum singaporense]|uniref:restriction endonuclease subunit S n=1 Tax=Tenacibaculum singaporense TaxID=2358479 RepID=UPI00351756A7
MKQYKTYKDSGVEWIGEIPEHWKSQDLRYSIDILTDYTSNGSFASLAKNVNYLESGYSRLVRLTDLRVDLKNEGIYVDENAHNFLKNSELFGGELLIANVGAYAGLIKIMPKLEGKYTLAPNMFLLRTNQNLKYLFYLLSSPSCAEQLKMMAVSSAQPKLNKDNIRRVKVVIPSLEEQNQIANYLNHKTEQLDSLIAKKEQLIKLLEEERKAVINQAVTKGVNLNVPMKDSGIEWLGEIPEHWEVTRIKYIGKIISGYSFKSDDFKDEGIRVMKISNIQTMRIDWTDDSYLPYSFLEEYSRFRINKGDLVFALTRPIISTGIKASIVNEDSEILLNQRNAVLKPISKLEIQWMYYMIFNEAFTQHFESLIDSTGQQPNISSTDIGNISIPLPSKQEQISIINNIKSKEQKINNTIESFVKEIDLLKEYKTALISEVVTGKIDIREEILN